MKSFWAYLFLILLCNAGIESVWHQLEIRENHGCKADTSHLCALEEHHHCNLCDVVFSGLFYENDIIKSAKPFHFELYAENSTHPTYQSLRYVNFLRGPPQV